MQKVHVWHGDKLLGVIEVSFYATHANWDKAKYKIQRGLRFDWIEV